MNKVAFIALIIVLHIVFIIVQIYKESSFVKLSYEHQRKQQELRQLQLKHDELKQELYALHNHADIQQYAQAELNMKKTRPYAIKRLSHENSI